MWTKYSNLKPQHKPPSQIKSAVYSGRFPCMKEEKNELSKLIFLDTTGIRNSPSQLHSKLPSTMPAMKYRCGIYTGNEVLQTNNYLFHWVCSAVSHESKVWTIEPIPCSRMEPESNHSHPMSTHSSHNHTKDTKRSFHALDSWCLLGFEFLFLFRNFTSVIRNVLSACSPKYFMRLMWVRDLRTRRIDTTRSNTRFT